MIWLLPWEKDVETRHTPWATWLIVFINVIVFLMMALSSDSGESAIASFGLSARDPHWYQNITSLPSVGASGCISAVAGAYGALFLASSIGVRVFLLVFPLATVQLPAVLFLLLYFGSDVYSTYAGHGALDPQDGANFVAHGIGFVFGLVVGNVGLWHGLRRRYETLEDGDDWFGYWPARLEATARRKRYPRKTP